MNASDDLARVLDGAAVLLDFDGPVCSIFAGLPAPEVARSLVTLLRGGAVEVPAAVAQEPDPLAVLRWAGQAGNPETVKRVEDELCAQELRAVAVAEPTPGARELIEAAQSVDRPIAVVSNNSAPAVRRYLEAHNLDWGVSVVVGRAYAEPERMKPNPDPILIAARELGAEPADCVLIGDSLADIEGARAAGVRAIGYANRPWKIHAFRHADAVTTSMATIADVLATRPR